MKPNKMNEFQAMARSASSPVAPGAQTAPGSINTATIDAQLGGQIARPDMGALRNFLANSHEGKQRLVAFKAIATEKYTELTRLGIEALKAEAALVREQLKVEFQRRYAAIAERAAAGQIEVTRRLQAVHFAARELLLDDRAEVLESLCERHQSGRLSDDDLRTEVAHVWRCYGQRLDEVTGVIDERRQCVRDAYGSDTHPTK